MKISLFRIDDRLIHGQIVTVWISHSEASMIVVADDATAKDEFMGSMLRMATPASLKLKILSLEDAAKFLKEDSSNEKILLLVKNPAAALYMLENGIEVEKINLGNLNHKQGKQKVLPNFWTFQEDIDAVVKIYEKGCSIEVQVVPSEGAQDALGCIKKANLL